MNRLPTHRGLTWDIEVLDPSRTKVLDRFRAENLVPIEGLNFMLRAMFKAETVPPAWYISIYEGDYTPTDDVTAATLPSLATEITTYTPAARPEFIDGPVVNGSTSNAASLAEFTFTAAKTVRVLALSSAAAKGSTSGVLLSVVRLPSPRAYEVGSILRAFAGPTALSVTS